MSGYGPSRHLLRQRKGGCYRSEADMIEIYEYAPKSTLRISPHHRIRKQARKQH